MTITAQIPPRLSPAKLETSVLRTLGSRQGLTQGSVFRGGATLLSFAAFAVGPSTIGGGLSPFVLGESLAGRQTGSSVVRDTAVRSSIRKREQELLWLRTHKHELSTLAGQWIALDGDTVLAAGPDPVDVIRQAKSKGVRSPFLHRVEDDREIRRARMGL